jgi:hypothetical protein
MMCIAVHASLDGIIGASRPHCSTIPITLLVPAEAAIPSEALMKSLFTFALSLLLLNPGLAQERVARVGFLSWQDQGTYYATPMATAAWHGAAGGAGAGGCSDRMRTSTGGLECKLPTREHEHCRMALERTSQGVRPFDPEIDPNLMTSEVIR